MIMKKTITKSKIMLVRGDKLKELGNRIIQIDTTKQYENNDYGVYIVEVDCTEEMKK